VAGLVVTASLIIVIRDWRVSLAALLAQYLLVGFLLTRLIAPEVATVKTLVGALHQLMNAFAKRFPMLQQCLVDQVTELFHSS